MRPTQAKHDIYHVACGPLAVLNTRVCLGFSHGGCTTTHVSWKSLVVSHQRNRPRARIIWFIIEDNQSGLGIVSVSNLVRGRPARVQVEHLSLIFSYDTLLFSFVNVITLSTPRAFDS